MHSPTVIFLMLWLFAAHVLTGGEPLPFVALAVGIYISITYTLFRLHRHVGDTPYARLSIMGATALLLIANHTVSLTSTYAPYAFACVVAMLMVLAVKATHVIFTWGLK